MSPYFSVLALTILRKNEREVIVNKNFIPEMMHFNNDKPHKATRLRFTHFGACLPLLLISGF